MQLRPKTFCPKCYESVPYYLRQSEKKISVREVSFSYLEIEAVCKECHNPVYVPAINDKNVYERHKAYYEALSNICMEEIQNGIIQEKVSA